MIIEILSFSGWIVLSGYLYYLVKTDIYRFRKIKQIATLVAIWFMLLIVVCMLWF